MRTDIVVITTIQSPTKSVEELRRRMKLQGLSLLAVGDRKTPDEAWHGSGELLSLSSHKDLGFELAKHLPENHYSRKNLGYLEAIRRGASSIFDTDDDNAPLPGWAKRGLEVSSILAEGRGWLNVYERFSEEALIWPRGFPLEEVRGTALPAVTSSEPQVRVSPVQQTLVNGSPDVDAIWRLIQDRQIQFNPGPSITLGCNVWCPFNSQSTWWFPIVFPLLYLPSHVSFRMTDIWRSFVAQRCLWALGFGVTFHTADMFQDRNPHDLLRDFEQEVPGYLNARRIRNTLEELTLATGQDSLRANLRACYVALIAAGIVPETELSLLDYWIADLDRAQEVELPSQRLGS